MKKLFILRSLIIVSIFFAGCTKTELTTGKTSSLIKKNSVGDEETINGITQDNGYRNGGQFFLFSPTRWVVADNFQISERLDTDVQDIQIEVKIWADQTQGEHHCDLTVQVEDDFVIIGGGARIRSTDDANPDVDINAALTAMHPVDDGQFNKYTASSKDHEVPYAHKLVVYAVG